MEISPKSKDRLLALLRPADDVEISSRCLGLLHAILDEPSSEGRIAALTFVLEEQPYAHLSGPPTLAQDYPAPLSEETARQWVEDARKERPPSSGRRFAALTAQIKADEPPTAERARRAWEFISTFQSESARAGTLHAVIASGAYTPAHRAPDPETLRFTENVADVELSVVLWRNREVLRQLHGAFMGDAAPQFHVQGDVVLRVISTIEDERERAIVFGQFLSDHCTQHPLNVIASLLGAL
ncbi:MAG: hypothetical protein Q7T01_04375 [bacterium]|nr:hypothetical protein [bacterium]